MFHPGDMFLVDVIQSPGHTRLLLLPDDKTGLVSKPFKLLITILGISTIKNSHVCFQTIEQHPYVWCELKDVEYLKKYLVA